MNMQPCKTFIVTLAAIAIGTGAFAQEKSATGEGRAMNHETRVLVSDDPAEHPRTVVVPTKPGEPQDGPAAPGAPPVLGRVFGAPNETSPEVAIAEAQLREAQAKLQQAKIEAAQRAIEIDQARRLVELGRNNVKRVEQMVENGVAPMADLSAAQERLAAAEAAVAKYDAASKIGKSSEGLHNVASELGLLSQPRIPTPRPELSDEDKSETVMALDSPVSIEFEEETLRNISEFISEYVDVNIVMDVGLHAADEPVSIKLSDVPLKDGLLALADAYGDVCFVIRDYGIFATTAERAITINAPTIPANVPLLVSIQEASARGVGASGIGFGFGRSSGTGGGGRAGGLAPIPGMPRFGGLGGGAPAPGAIPEPRQAEEPATQEDGSNTE